MACKTITQAEVDKIESNLNTIPGVTNVVQSGSDPNWFMDYDTDCGGQRGKVVIIPAEESTTGDEEIGLEMETP